MAFAASCYCGYVEGRSHSSSSIEELSAKACQALESAAKNGRQVSSVSANTTYTYFISDWKREASRVHVVHRMYDHAASSLTQ